MMRVLWKDGQGKLPRRNAAFDSGQMIELPDFSPLRTTATSAAPTRAALDGLDHVLVVAPHGDDSALIRLPYGKQLAALLARARKNDDELVGSRAANSRATGLTVASFKAKRGFAALTWAAKAVHESLRDKPRTLGIAFAGLGETDEAIAAESLLAAAGAAAFALPAFKSARAPKLLASVRLFGARGAIDLATARAQTLGNNVARWFTALPPNVLTMAAYRKSIEAIAKARGIGSRFLGERELAKLKAGAFLAVAGGNATRDAGILHLRYRPTRSAQASLALVGKGIIFDTGGTNLKPFLGMLEMHRDMQGSAVAFGTLLALAELQVPFGIDAWFAITENRLGAEAYKSQDLITAANGTTIQVIHTDAEGRMVLADTLALAAREKPGIIIDYATLTGSCETALTARYSGVFANRSAANALLQQAGADSGERVWPFPMDDDYDELLKSDIADIKQCSAESAGDHILGARFLSRFVPKSIPWVHVDLSAGEHKGGLAHVPTDITGFGVRLTVELLMRTTHGADDLKKRLEA
jgi:leucyl aminopeptidase